MSEEVSLAGIWERLGELGASAKERASQNTELFTLSRATLHALSTMSADVRSLVEEMHRHAADDSETHNQVWAMMTRHHEAINGVEDDPERGIRGRLDSLERSRATTLWLARVAVAAGVGMPTFFATCYGLYKAFVIP